MTNSDTPLFRASYPERPRRAADRVAVPALDMVRFSQSAGGGYDPEEVDAFVSEMRHVLEATENERTALRADVAQLKDSTGTPGTPNAALDAVGLLSQAQVIADKCIGDAETYARDLMMTARTQYRAVLDEAEKRAKEAAAQVEDAVSSPVTDGARHPDPATRQPVAEVEYVRTYARVAQVQLRAVLDALAEQVDMLGDVPSADAPPQDSSSEGAQPPPSQRPETAGASGSDNGPSTAGQPPVMSRRHRREQEAASNPDPAAKPGVAAEESIVPWAPQGV